MLASKFSRNSVKMTVMKKLALKKGLHYKDLSRNPSFSVVSSRIAIMRSASTRERLKSSLSITLE